MINSKQISFIKESAERFTEGLISNQNEFIFDVNNKTLPAGEIYSSYVTLDKKEIFMTGLKNSSDSKILLKKNKDSLLNTYANIVSRTKEKYPKNQPLKPTEDDYRLGVVTRYFSRVGNDNTKPIIEISKEDYTNRNSLYIYFETKWVIRGTKEEVSNANADRIRYLQRRYSNISQILFPLQLWRPDLDSPEDIENKLSRLKK